MSERPLNSIKNRNQENFKRTKHLIISVFERADAFSLWIIGFSVGGIGLLLSNSEKLKHSFNQDITHSISISLCTSIIAGIFFRYIYMWFFMINIKMFDRLISDYSSENELPILTNSQDLNGFETFEELVVIVEQYTGKDLSHFITDFINADDAQKLSLRQSLHDYYLQNDSFNNIDSQRGNEFVRNMNSIYFRRTPNPARPGLLRGCTYWLAVTVGAPFFLTFIIAFIYALCLFCFNFHI